jgi:UPF0716 protein FxsA
VNRSKLLAYAIAGWILVEVIAFVIVVQILGLMAALALGVGTTLLGLADVRRLFEYLRTRAAGKKSEAPAQGAPQGVALVDGGLQALGALLLILPGFASDLIGLALKAPSIRAGVSERIRKGPKQSGPTTIDLAPTEWKALHHGPQKRRRRRPPPIEGSEAPL